MSATRLRLTPTHRCPGRELMAILNTFTGTLHNTTQNQDIYPSFQCSFILAIYALPTIKHPFISERDVHVVTSITWLLCYEP